MNRSSGRKTFISLGSLVAVVLFAATMLYLFRDGRITVDGCEYAAAAIRFMQGDFRDIFRWTHPLHVPALSLLHLLFSCFTSMELIESYQIFDIIAGAACMGLLFLAGLRLTHRISCALAGCTVMFFSWGFFNEACIADEKMFGFAAVLLFVCLLFKDLMGPLSSRAQPPSRSAGFLAGFVLAAAILLHASSVLVVPMAIYLAIRIRADGYLISAATTVSVLLFVCFVLFITLQGDTPDGARSYFSTSLAANSVLLGSYSFSIGFVATIAQGMTKLFWAVFAEDSRAKAVIFACLHAVFLLFCIAAFWRLRRAPAIRALFILFVTATAFGITYAPNCWDSYLISLIAIALLCACAGRHRTYRIIIVAYTVLLAANNLPAFIAFSKTNSRSIEKEYALAVKETLRGEDHLIVLDPTIPGAGFRSVWPIHAYINPHLHTIAFSDYVKRIDNASYVKLAEQGNLYIEGICFEDNESIATASIQNGRLYQSIAGRINLTEALSFSEYSDLMHRRYKNIYSIRYLPGQTE